MPGLLALGAMVVGCASDDDSVQRSEDEVRDPAGGAVQVVEDYLDALRSGDVEAALRYRCRDAGDLPVESTGEQIERLSGLIGEIEAVEVRVIDRPTTLVDDGGDPVVVGYRLVIDGQRHPELQAVTVIDDGERRWCGGATSMTDQLFSEQHDELVVTQPTTATDALIDFMPSTGPPGETVQPDESSVPTVAFDRPHPGQMGSWSRAWEKPEHGGSRVSAIRFEIGQQAVDAARYALRLKFHDSVETFVIEEAPGAVGIRVLELAWLDVQPPDVGPYVDWVYIVYGGTMVEVAVSELMDDPDHEAAAGLVRQVHDMAAVAPS